jgi:hypothetical protein
VAAMKEHEKILIGILIIGILTFGFFNFLEKKQRGPSLQLFNIGVIYMLFVMAVSGPASLILGNPALVAPVVYGSLLGGSLVGGWVVLKSKRRFPRLEVALLLAFCMLLATFLLPIKQAMISLQLSALRFTAVVALCLIFGTLIEIPYMSLLAEVEEQKRARRFFLENCGTVLGVPAGLLLQLNFGVNQSFWCITAMASFFAASVFISHRRSRGALR